MKRLLIFTATTLLVLSFWPSATGAQNWQPGGKGMRMDGNFDCLAGNLDLTESQKIAVRELTASQRAERPARREAMNALRNQIQEAVNAENPDAELIGELMLQKKALRDEAQVRRDEIHGQIFDLLDDEQKVEFEAMKESRDGRFQGRIGRGSRRGMRSNDCFQEGPLAGARGVRRNR